MKNEFKYLNSVIFQRFIFLFKQMHFIFFTNHQIQNAKFDDKIEKIVLWLFSCGNYNKHAENVNVCRM